MTYYTTAANIQKYIQDTIGVDTAPDEVSVTALIEEYEATVNAWLSFHGMSPPLTEPENIEFLRGMIDKGVACDVWGMYAQDEIDRPMVTRWCDAWQEFKNDIKEGKFALPNKDEGGTGEGDGFTPGYSFPKITRE